MAGAHQIRVILLALSLSLVDAQQAGSPAANRPTLSSSALADFSSLEPIDTHAHVFQTGPDFLGMLERLHMHILDVLVVDDTNPYRTTIEPGKTDALKFIAASAGHAWLCTTFDPYQFNKPDFGKAATDALNLDFARGAVAVKIWKNVGMEIKNASGQYILPDDPRLAPIYQDIASHGKTLLAHLAEPDAAWGSQDPKAPYSGYYRANPLWDMSKVPGAPAKSAILTARDRVLAMNPQLRMVGAHLGSMEGDLDQIADRLQRYPNFAVDTSARVQSLVIQPRDKVRAFILKYQDRILYGTDLGFYPERTAEAAAREWEGRYALDWRYFATEDSFEYSGRKVEGLGLPRAVLKKLYHDNAVHWFPGIERLH
jgi:predicted TIM-barrel fold metal-dependent hydrolase